jgi:hypothetical protein
MDALGAVMAIGCIFVLPLVLLAIVVLKPQWLSFLND